LNQPVEVYPSVSLQVILSNTPKSLVLSGFEGHSKRLPTHIHSIGIFYQGYIFV